MYDTIEDLIFPAAAAYWGLDGVNEKYVRCSDAIVPVWNAQPSFESLHDGLTTIYCETIHFNSDRLTLH